jgi:uncharacterized iron-regulated membrane protein
MSSYLLPCACGQRTPVSNVQAGQSVRCACGAQLQVPNLRDLRALASVETSDRGPARARRLRAWDNRHRLAFLLCLVALCGLAISVYWALRLPELVTRATPGQIEEWFQQSPPSEVFRMYDDLQKGLRPTHVAIAGQAERNAMLWGIRFALAISALGLIAAVGVLRRGRAQRNQLAAR